MVSANSSLSGRLTVWASSSRLVKSLATNRHQFLSLRRSRWTPEKNKELMRSLRGWLPRRSSKQLLVLSKETGL